MKLLTVCAAAGLSRFHKLVSFVDKRVAVNGACEQVFIVVRGLAQGTAVCRKVRNRMAKPVDKSAQVRYNF